MIFLLFLLCSILSVSNADGISDEQNLSSQIQNENDLRYLIQNNNDTIIVTIWVDNMYEKRNHNSNNHLFQGLVQELISRFHPHAIYVEVDMSDYSTEAFLFEDLAWQWNLDLGKLMQRPLFMPIFKQKGLFLWGEENTSIKSIVKALHQHLLYLEQINFKDNIEYDVDFEELIRDVESEKYGNGISSNVRHSNQYWHFNPYRQHHRFYPANAPASYYPCLDYYPYKVIKEEIEVEVPVIPEDPPSIDDIDPFDVF